MHNLFSFLLGCAGPSLIRISTFSLSDVAIRNFILELDNNMINDSKIILDYSLTRRNIDQLLFAENVLKNIRLCDNHSKIMIITGKLNSYAVIGSANFNENRKTESGIIFENHHAIDVLTAEFDDLFNKSIAL